MITKNEKNDFLHMVYKVDKTKEVNGKKVTKILIRDKILNTVDDYMSCWVTIFDEVDITEGQFVKVLDFDNVVVSYFDKTKKLTLFMSGIVEVADRKPLPERKVNNPYAD